MAENKEKLVYESDDLEKEDELGYEKTSEEIEKIKEFQESTVEDVPMSNGENCGIVEFEGERINTCKGEKIVKKGYESPDNK
ncbi:hypothetical protein JNO63_07360 [Anaerococcus sp. mt242]|mgnify:FL=1|uniref:hypothetical protein n=1 Tax=Anaerococcus sp. mt242 TaxID=2661917 RepID=UPI001931603A|nr:hypothetical protein [Anaerococcus sp. mt242]MBM0046909.1 hypothetical protein [Anaerococcus sp. mt242]